MAAPSPRSRPERRNPSLLPREHGVYAEVLFPIVTALWIGPASLAGTGFAIAIVAAFLAHEPALVLLGRRGSWAKTGLGAQARRYLVLLTFIAVACGVVGMWHASTPVRIAFLVLVPVTIPLAFLVGNRQEKTIAGECLIAFIVSIASIPIAMAGGASVHVGGAAALVWMVVFVTSTVTVHAILARTKRRTQIPALIVMSLSLMVILLAASRNIRGGPMWLVALIPAPLVAFGVLAARLPVQRLRILGWLLVGGNLATAILLVWSLG